MAIQYIVTEQERRQEKINELMGRGCALCIREAQRFYPEFDLHKAANGNSHPNEFKDQFFRIYSKLVEEDAIVEAYCLLKMAFAQLSTEDLMRIYEDSKLLTEELAYQAAKHDQETEAPF